MFAFLMILASCREDVTEMTTTETRPDPTVIKGYEPIVEPITSSVIGHVTDENNQNVENAVVTMGDLSTTTNEYGHFFFTRVEMNAKGSFVLIEKDGYFGGSRRFYPTTENVSHVAIEMLEKNFSSSFESSAGGLVMVDQGGSIEFSANAIVDADDLPFDGTVQVASRWLNPGELATVNQMPGDLTAVDELNEVVALATFGMMAVELQSTSGAPLNVAASAHATLTFPVPNDMIGQAPAEIELWYFNEHYGIWAQDGTATLQGDKYVGDVNHFTFWNCDAPFDLVNIDFTLVNDMGDPLANHLVIITLNSTISGSGMTNSVGYLSGKIPANESLLMEVISTCGDVIYSETIGPYTADISLGDVIISPPSGTITTTITGNLLNCDSNPVTDGLVIADFDGFREYLYTDGTPFNFSITTCPTTTDVTITGVDFDNPGHTSENIVPSGTTTPLGDVDVCNAAGPMNTITVSIDGTQFIYSNATADISGVDSIGNFIESDLGAGLYCGFGFEGTTTGTFNGFFEGIFNNDLGWWLRSNGPSTFDITEFGPNPGDKIKGSFDGTLYDAAGVARVVDLEFDITRE